MPMPLQVQQAGTATSAAGPASIAPAFGGGTTAGNFLVAVVCVAASGAPSVATPANWTAGPTVVQGTNIAAFVFYFPNCTAGITTVTFTLTNANGATAQMIELTGVASVLPLDGASVQSASNASSTAFSVPTFTSITNTDELWIAVEACLSGSTFTNNAINGTQAWAFINERVSTVGATNVRANVAVTTPVFGTVNPITQGSAPNSQAQIVATLSGATSWCGMMLCFYGAESKRYIRIEQGLMVV